MDECPRRNKLFGRCRFEPRYDLSALRPITFNADHIPSADFAALLDAQRARTYVRDVCVTCGKVIAR